MIGGGKKNCYNVAMDGRIKAESDNSLVFL
ncbi:hypothetical protein CsSME_00016085 [Camellia sinensis var. sinensis]